MSLGFRRSTTGSGMNRGNRTKKKLFEDVYLYTTKIQEPYSLTYEVQCHRFTNISIEIDFNDSENVAFHPSPALIEQQLRGRSTMISDMKVKVTIRAFTNLVIGTIKVVDEYQSLSVSTKYQYIEELPDSEEIERYLSIHHAEMHQKNEGMRKLYGDILANSRNLSITMEMARDVFAQYGKSFLDLFFPPEESSIFHSTDHLQRMQKDGNYEKFHNIEWKRPVDFMKIENEGTETRVGAIQVFQDGIEPADIIQGYIGDCWFLSSLAALAEVPILVESLFPLNSRGFNPAGMYEIRFCKNGLWQAVSVDDYFPCFPGSGPIFSRSHGNELWVMLVEKAYAKFHGSYLSIQSGLSSDALIDLTGAPFKTIPFPSLKAAANDTEENGTIITESSIWDQLLDGLNQEYLMSSATRGEDEFLALNRPSNSIGLVSDHAYTIITLRESSKGDKLVKLRNPWGSLEWNGDWSDKSDKWTEEMREEIENVVEADDGVFWMCLHDFTLYFDSVNVCMVRIPEYTSDHPWYESRLPFPLQIGLSNPPSPSSSIIPATGFEITPESVQSPLFRITLEKKGRLIFTIHQRDIRCPNTPAYVDIGFIILRVINSGSKEEFEFIAAKNWKLLRQNQSNEIELDAGEYIFVPFSSGCKLWQFYEAASSSDALPSSLVVHPEDRPPIFVVYPTSNGTQKLQLSSTAIDIYTDIFHRLDKDNSNYLSKPELDIYMEITTGQRLTEHAFNQLLQQYEHSSASKRGLSLNSFLTGQIQVFNRLFMSNHRNLSAVEEIFHKEIEKFGYSRRSYQWLHGRIMVFSVHSTVEQFKVRTVPYDSNIVKLAQELFIIHEGTKEEHSGKLALYDLNNGFEGSSLLAQNLQETKELSLTVDLSGSKNIVSHRKNLKFHAKIPAKGKCIVLHVMPKDEKQSWTSSPHMEFV